MNNDNHVVVHRNEADTGSNPKPLVAGIVYADLAHNDFLGTAEFGVNNRMEIPASFAYPDYYTVIAENHYWADASGPYHLTLPPGGTGVQ